MDCEQFTKDLQEILDWVRLQSALPGGTFSEAELEAFPYSDEVADDELTPAEEDACAIGQLWYEWGYQTVTEYVLPATRWGFDYLIPALAAFIATAIGGPVAGAGVWAIAEFIQEIMEIGYRGAETNLVNWMDTNKQDIVCLLFNYLKVGGDASAIWAQVEAAIIDPAEDISYGDKLMLHLFMGSWAGSNAQLAFDEETEWATSNVQEGYCDSCEAAPWFWEWSMPPHTGWTLTATNAGWTEGEWAWWKQGNGGIVSPALGAIPYGDYTWHVNEHVKGSAANPDHAVVIRQVDHPDHFWGGPLWDEFDLVNAPNGSWADLEADGTITIGHPYAYLHITGRPGDGVGCEGDYWELTLTPVV